MSSRRAIGIRIGVSVVCCGHLPVVLLDYHVLQHYVHRGCSMYTVMCHCTCVYFFLHRTEYLGPYQHNVMTIYCGSDRDGSRS